MKKLASLFALIIAGESIFLLPFVLSRVFRPTFLRVFEITNFELGVAFSVYGFVAMASYFLGGPIADRFSVKRLLIVSLVSTGLGGIILMQIPNSKLLAVLYGFWGISSILLFWAAFIKATRILATKKTQAKTFGLVEAGRGLTAALIATTAVFLLDFLLSDSAETTSLIELKTAFSYVILAFSLFTLLSALLIFILFQNDNKKKTTSDQLDYSIIKKLIGSKTIWLQAIIVLCAYVGYKATDDFSLYANEVLKFNEVESAHIGTISFWMRPLVALLAAFIGDKILNINAIIIGFLTVIIAALLLSYAWVISELLITAGIMSVTFYCLGIYALRALYFTLLEETKLSILQTGTAIGIISFIGYSPDLFFGPLMGYILDENPAVEGHQKLFLVVSGFAFIGLISSILLKKKINT